MPQKKDASYNQKEDSQSKRLRKLSDGTDNTAYIIGNSYNSY